MTAPFVRKERAYPGFVVTVTIKRHGETLALSERSLLVSEEAMRHDVTDEVKMTAGDAYRDARHLLEQEAA